MVKKKKLSSYRIGKIRENQVASFYEKLGFDVQLVTQTRFQKQDFFNLFDFIAVNQKKGIEVWGQVKSNACPNQVHKDIKNFKLCKDSVKTIWVYKHLKRGEYWEVVDFIYGNEVWRMVDMKGKTIAAEKRR